MEKYKLRFEACADVVEFIKSMHLFIEDYKVEDGNSFSFWTNISLLNILHIISEITDGHVMYETLAPYNKYTGDRSNDNYENHVV